MSKRKRPPPPSLDDRMRREFKETLREFDDQPPIEPTPEEKRNGWTTESLTAYMAEQKAASELKVDPHSAMNRANRRPVRANSRYNPHRWR